MTTPERPMLFSAPMVQALLAGRKTQTRRIAKPRRRCSLLDRNDDGSNLWTDGYILDLGNAEWLARDAPARAGEEMYVREAFRFGPAFDLVKPSDVGATEGVYPTVFYEADAEAKDGWVGLKVGKLRPGIHMPRWCSRIERTIVGCRLERLNDCSSDDARAEGLEWASPSYGIAGIAPSWQADPVAAYAALWDHINGPGAWAANPLVWVIEFSPA